MILPSPLRDKVGYSNHDRFRGYCSVHFRSGLQAPCLRFAGTVTGHHARLGTQLPAKLYFDRHFRRLYLMRLQGATPTPPGLGKFTLSFNPLREPFRPSAPALRLGLSVSSAFRHWSASLALPAQVPTMPFAGSCMAIDTISRISVQFRLRVKLCLLWFPAGFPPVP